MTRPRAKTFRPELVDGRTHKGGACHAIRVACAMVGALSVVLFARPAHAIKVRVGAATRLEAKALPSRSGAVVVQGTLRDDVGAPIADTHVGIAFYAPNALGSALPLPFPRACPDKARAPDAHEPHVAPDEYVVDTDSSGSFCFETTLPVDRALLRVTFAGTPLYDATQTETPVNVEQPPASIAFDPEPNVVSLDRPSYPVGIRLTAPGVAKRDLRVVVSDERGKELGTAEVEADGLARVDLATENLADPGPGELRAALLGYGVVSAPIAHPIERHARVEIVPIDLHPKGVPEDGMTLPFEVRTNRGPAQSGALEALVGGRTVGTGQVRAGRATVIATFASSERAVGARVRYLPEAPWFEPGAPLPLTIEAEPASGLRRLILVLIAGLAFAFMLRRTIALPSRPRGAALRPNPAPHEDVKVVRERTAEEGWSGCVVDAHDGVPVAGAEVMIIVHAFPGREQHDPIKARATSDSEGRFSLRLDPPPKDAVLRVEAPWHCLVEQPLPRPGDLSIALALRRRKLLERLVDWAFKEWGPADPPLEPTPRQVETRARLRAGRRPETSDRAAAIAAWARAVEEAAYGPAPVDERVERSVNAIEPPK